MQKIFIIEDDALLMRMLERVFTFEHFEVLKAADGAEAIAKLIMMEDAPAAVILDMMIPVLSGMDVLKKIKKDDKFKNVPVVVLTGLSQGGENAEKILAEGAAMCILKTQYTPAEVVEKVKSVIAKA